VGIKHLKIAAQRSQTELQITWEPFLLNRSIPETGVTYQDYIAQVYGPGRGSAEQMRQSHARLAYVGSQVGIKFAEYDPARRIYPTLKSHVAVEAVKREMGDEAADRMMEELFRTYFESSGRLNNPDDIVEAARAAKVLSDEDGSALRATLADPSAQKETLEREASFKRRYPQCRGVPFFVIGDVTLSGAQPIEEFERVLRNAEPVVDLAAETEESLSGKSIKELKAMCRATRVSTAGFLEKSEFVRALLDKRMESMVCDPSNPASCV